MLTTPARFADPDANFTYIEASAIVTTHHAIIMAWDREEPQDFKVFARDGSYFYRIGCAGENDVRRKMQSFCGAHNLGGYTSLDTLRASHARALSEARIDHATHRHPLLVVRSLRLAATLRRTIARTLAERRHRLPTAA